jgi:hypothetical protein
MTPQVDLFGAATAVSIKVKLARDIDRENPCHDNVTVVYPGDAHHADEYRCAACGSHRGWLSHADCNFILETVRRFGPPPDPIIVRQQENKQMAFEQKDFSGAVFVNDRKREGEAGKNDPDRTGSAMIGGVEYYVSGWLRKTKDGKPYLSLAFKRKQEAPDRSRSRADEFQDSIPF